MSSRPCKIPQASTSATINCSRVITSTPQISTVVVCHCEVLGEYTNVRLHSQWISYRCIYIDVRVLKMHLCVKV